MKRRQTSDRARSFGAKVWLALPIAMLSITGCGRSSETVAAPPSVPQAGWCFDLSGIESVFETAGQRADGRSIASSEDRAGQSPRRHIVVEARLRPLPIAPHRLGPVASAQEICSLLEILIDRRCHVSGSMGGGNNTCSRFAVQADTEGWLDVAVVRGDDNDAWFVATVTEVVR